MMAYKVLVPVDQSNICLKILDQVQRFIGPERAEIILFHVASPPQLTHAEQARYYAADFQTSIYLAPTQVEPSPPPIYSTQLEDSIRANLEGEFLVKAHGLRAAGYPVSVQVKFGDPVKEIVKFVTEADINLVAMTSRCREGLPRLIKGSVAERVLHQVRVPVLVLHPSRARDN